MGHIHLVDARNGAPARWSTTVAVSWAHSGLDIRFDCRDDLAWGTFQERDAPLWQEEVVEVFLAPILELSRREDAAEYFEIEVSPLGALFDARVHNPDGDRETMEVETSWDWPGIEWRAGRSDIDLKKRRSVGAQDWWAELHLPWAGLGFRNGEEPRLWHLNIYRVERPAGVPGVEDEFSAWAPTMKDPADFHRPERFGLLAAEDLLTQSRGETRREVEKWRRALEAAARPILVLPRPGLSGPGSFE